MDPSDDEFTDLELDSDYDDGDDIQVVKFQPWLDPTSGLDPNCQFWLR